MLNCSDRSSFTNKQGSFQIIGNLYSPWFEPLRSKPGIEKTAAHHLSINKCVIVLMKFHKTCESPLELLKHWSFDGAAPCVPAPHQLSSEQGSLRSCPLFEPASLNLKARAKKPKVFVPWFLVIWDVWKGMSRLYLLINQSILTTDASNKIIFITRLLVFRAALGFWWLRLVAKLEIK